MGFDVTLLGAAAAGLASFASPCVLPIVPPYLCFIAGVSVGELTGEQAGARGRVVAAALAFALGFATVFVLMGATASTLGRALAAHHDALRWTAGGLILALGLHFLGVLRIPLLHRQVRVEASRRPTSLAGAYLVGLAFAFGWTPCVGPVLAAILFTAGAQQTAWQGAALLGAYAAGMGAPFVAAAAFAGPFLALMRRARRWMGVVEKSMGAALVATGLVFVINGMPAVAGWMTGFVPIAG